MKLALLMGNRFSTWHLQMFGRLPGAELTAFRAQSEIQQYFEERDDRSVACAVEKIRFETDSLNPFTRVRSRLRERFRSQAPRLLPFHQRLRGFDVIQTWELFTDWTLEALEAKQRFGIPVSVMVWDTLPFHFDDDPIRFAIKQRAIREADAFVVHTEHSLRVLQLEGVAANRIHLVPPAVDSDRFCPGEADRKKLNLDPNEFTILFVGWFLPRKGLDFLLMALRMLLDDRVLARHRFRLVVVGSGPGRERIDGLVARMKLSEHVTFVGSQSYSQMPELYRAADLFVLPSVPTPDWQEQFGMALIEAMATGTPALSTHSGAIPEIAGDAARLVPPADFVALYDAIRALTLTEQRRKALGAAGVNRVRQHFALNIAAAKLGAVYDTLLARDTTAENVRPAV